MMAAVQHTSASRSLAALLDRELAQDLPITGLSLDSRQVQPGDLFLAMAGEQHDGRQFMEQAVAAGAVAVAADAPASGFVEALPVPLIEIPELAQEAGPIAARFYSQPSSSMRVIGVTGTNGKTTVTRLLAQLLRALKQPSGVIGTLGASLGDELSEARNTTPDALALQQCLAQWRDQNVAAVAMEVSSHALVQGRVNGLHFDTAVFTNLSRDHLDYHLSMAAYARAKATLFAWEGLRHALINSDDPYGATLAMSAAANTQVLRYSAAGDPAAELRASNLHFHSGGVKGLISTPWGEGEFSSPLPGDFNVANLLAAIGCTLLGGHALQDVLAAVSNLQPVPGRLQSIANELGVQVLVDYAHTPDALEQVLRAIKPHIEGQLITVFGCGGDRDAGKRSVMGRIACEISDRVIVTSDNPRTENPQAILQDIAVACTGDFSLQVDRALAIAEAIASAAPGDCVLIAGKGHEDYQIIEGQRLHFSDAEQAQAALNKRAAS